MSMSLVAQVNCGYSYSYIRINYDKNITVSLEPDLKKCTQETSTDNNDSLKELNIFVKS